MQYTIKYAVCQYGNFSPNRPNIRFFDKRTAPVFCGISLFRPSGYFCETSFSLSAKENFPLLSNFLPPTLEYLRIDKPQYYVILKVPEVLVYCKHIWNRKIIIRDFGVPYRMPRPRRKVWSGEGRKHGRKPTCASGF